MLDKIKAAIAQRKSATEQTLAAQYEALLAEAIAGKLGEHDVERVERVLAACNLTLQDMETDINLAAECRELEKVAAPLEQLRATVKALLQQRGKMEAEHAAMVKANQAARAELEKKIGNTQVQFAAAANAREQLGKRFPASNQGALHTLSRKRSDLVDSIESNRRVVEEAEREIRNSMVIIDQTPKTQADRIETLQDRVGHYRVTRDQAIAAIAKAEKEIARIDVDGAKLQAAA